MNNINNESGVRNLNIQDNINDKKKTTKNKIKKALQNNMNDLLFSSNYFSRTKNLLNKINSNTKDIPNIKKNSNTKYNYEKINSSQKNHFNIFNKVIGFIFLIYLISGKLNNIRKSINLKELEDSPDENPSSSNISDDNRLTKYLTSITFYLIILSIILITNIFIFNFKLSLSNNNPIIYFLKNVLKESLDLCVFGFNIAILMIISPPMFTFLLILFLLYLQVFYIDFNYNIFSILNGTLNNNLYYSYIPIILLILILITQNIMYFNISRYLSSIIIPIIIILIIILLLVLIIYNCIKSYKIKLPEILLGIKYIKENINTRQTQSEQVRNNNGSITVVDAVPV